jgi:hypothetical protein
MVRTKGAKKRHVEVGPFFFLFVAFCLHHTKLGGEGVLPFLWNWVCLSPYRPPWCHIQSKAEIIFYMFVSMVSGLVVYTSHICPQRQQDMAQKTQEVPPSLFVKVVLPSSPPLHLSSSPLLILHVGRQKAKFSFFWGQTCRKKLHESKYDTKTHRSLPLDVLVWWRHHCEMLILGTWKERRGGTQQQQRKIFCAQQLNWFCFQGTLGGCTKDIIMYDR